MGTCFHITAAAKAPPICHPEPKAKDLVSKASGTDNPLQVILRLAPQDDKGSRLSPSSLKKAASCEAAFSQFI